MDTLTNASKRNAALALLLLLPMPSLGSFAFLMFPPTLGTPVGKAIYIIGKVWILALPLLWWWKLERKPLSWSPLRKGGVLPAAGLGLLLGAGICVIWQVWGHLLIDIPFTQERMRASGTAEPLAYLVLACYLTFVNSLLEEYVWRWFVFLKFEDLLGTRVAVVLAALGFTLHHIIVLKANFSWLVTVLGSLGVFSGGLIWSWCYGRYRSVWPGYVSHLIVDAAIFWVGWQIASA